MTERDEANVVLRLTIGGREIEIDVRKDFTGLDARLFREQTGIGFAEGLTHIMDPDILATFVWLYQRKANKRLRWERVAEQITFDDVMESGERMGDDDEDDDEGEVLSPDQRREAERAEEDLAADPSS